MPGGDDVTATRLPGRGEVTVPIRAGTGGRRGAALRALAGCRFCRCGHSSCCRAGAARCPPGAAVAAGASASGRQIAAALRKSPLYVDPSLASAFPAGARKEISPRSARPRHRLYVAAVPLVVGGQWADAPQFADVVQTTLGEPGIYLTLDDQYASLGGCQDMAVKPAGHRRAPYHASDAALAADVDQGSALQSPPIWETILRCIQLIDTGRAVVGIPGSDDPDPERRGSTSGQAASSSSDGGPIDGGVLAAVAAGTGACRRGAEAPSAACAGTVRAGEASSQVADATRAETETGLRTRAQQELIELGTLLEQPGPAGADGRPGQYSDQRQQTSPVPWTPTPPQRRSSTATPAIEGPAWRPRAGTDGPLRGRRGATPARTVGPPEVN